MFLLTTDTQLTSASSMITSYFTNNLGVLIGVVIGISVFVWLLRVLYHSLMVRKVGKPDFLL